MLDWRDIDCTSIRTDGKRQVLDDMYSTIRNTLNDPLHTGSQSKSDGSLGPYSLDHAVVLIGLV